jgi:hypothetical protein
LIPDSGAVPAGMVGGISAEDIEVRSKQYGIPNNLFTEDSL